VAFYDDLIDRLEGERREQLRTASDPVTRQVLQLNTLRGIGINSAWLYAMEFFGWRQFRDGSGWLHSGGASGRRRRPCPVHGARSRPRPAVPGRGRSVREASPPSLRVTRSSIDRFAARFFVGSRPASSTSSRPNGSSFTPASMHDVIRRCGGFGWALANQALQPSAGRPEVVTRPASGRVIMVHGARQLSAA
jgi:hypothetical protein